MNKYGNELPELAKCPVCGEKIEEYYPNELLSRFPGTQKTHPRSCACTRAREAAERERLKFEEHVSKVNALRKRCFGHNRASYACTFSNSTLHTAAASLCGRYVDEWSVMSKENHGLLLWGDVGTGKSYMAASIANALIEREVAVRMLNLSDVMNAAFESREELLRDVSRCQLLIIDDFGMERETEYGMEISFQVIDARYQSGKPLIVTTNLALKTINNPTDLPHRRIYDRIAQMCNPIFFEGSSLRPGMHKQKMDRFRALINENKEVPHAQNSNEYK